jgi:DNA-binding NarL/FixJ family response regulator
VLFPASGNALRRPGCEAVCVAISCLIVDDNPSFLEAASALLEQEGVTVAGVASTIDEGLGQAVSLHPDVVLVDVYLGSESGLVLAQRLAEAQLSAPAAVVMISTCGEDDVADLIAGSPVAGFIPKAQLSATGIRRLVDRGSS